MEIKSLRIQGFKSLVDVTLHEPGPFTVFVGPNASGKSNFFEALEFLSYLRPGQSHRIINIFSPDVFCVNGIPTGGSAIEYEIQGSKGGGILSFNWTETGLFKFSASSMIDTKRTDDFPRDWFKDFLNMEKHEALKQQWPFSGLFFTERISVGNSIAKKINKVDNDSLALDASNLEPVLKRILQNEAHRQEITELLQLLIPGFDRVEIAVEPLSGSFNLLIYEEGMKKPLNRHLISNGTYNLLALIAAVYQSDQPQFLCIEEPENGLNPKVIKQLVKFFRQKCEEKGHYIWLNTHSQSLVAELNPGEIVLVDKKNGATQLKQIPKDFNLHGLRMDEALLTNALGGGIPW